MSLLSFVLLFKFEEISPEEAVFNVATNIPGVGATLKIGGKAVEIGGFAVSHVSTVLDLTQTAIGTSIFPSPKSGEKYYEFPEVRYDNMGDFLKFEKEDERK